MTDIAIRVENLSKLYRIGAQQERHDSLRDALVAGLRRNGKASDTNEFYALRDVSFEIRQGEAVGIIGRNGAGKSTLLKILSRITEPTSGRVEIHGRVASLLEVGTGFHPELTGRENIFLNGAILGMKRAEIVAKFDEIVAFAEIENFLDTPVKRYSSGMYVRLAFAVAAHLEPEILLVDEVLAVGDAEFQKKCLGKMGDVTESGRTVLFVSHNMAAVSNLCKLGVWFQDGRVVQSGEVHTTIAAYLAYNSQGPARNGGILVKDAISEVALVALGPVDDEGRELSMVRSGEDLCLAFLISSPSPIPRVSITAGLNDQFGTRVVVLHSTISGSETSLTEGTTRVTCRVKRLSLVPGNYSVDVRIYNEYGSLLWAPSLGPLVVETGDYYGTGKLPDPAWAGNVYFSQDWETRRV